MSVYNNAKKKKKKSLNRSVKLLTFAKSTYSILVCAQFSSVQFSRSVVSDSSWPHESSTPGLPVHHQLLEFTQTHVHRISDAIQSSHPLSSPSPPAPNPSQHQSLFQWVNSSHEVATGLEKVSFHSNPKERQCQRMLKLPHNCTHLTH